MSSTATSIGDPNYHQVATINGGNSTSSSASSSSSSKPIAAVKFSPDGHLLATAGADATIRIYRVSDPGLAAPASTSIISSITTPTLPASPTITSLLLYAELTAAHDAGINDLVFTHDSAYLLTASDDKTIIIWDMLTLKPLRTCRGHTSYVFCLNVSQLGNLIVSGSYDETVRVWDLKNAKQTMMINAHSDPVSAVDFNRDGSLIVSSSYDGLCRVWDTSSGRCLKTIYYEKTPPVSEEENSFVRFSPNGKYILASSLDSTLRLWDYSIKDHCLKEYTGHTNTKFCLSSSFSTLHSPKQYIVAGSEDGRIMWWNVASNEVVATMQAGKEAVLCIAAHPSVPILVSASMEAPYSIVLWKHQTK